MKVLIVNWSWYPTGGDWTYINNLKSLYEKNGYQIVALSAVHEKNIETDYPAYFIDSPDYKILNKRRNFTSGLKALKNSIVSSKALKKIDLILAEHDIQIAHLHNIHHYITPAIIWRLNKANVKIVWSLHDYQIICPQSLFISHGAVCEKCMGGKFYQCTLNRCKRNSTGASLLASIEAYFYDRSHVYEKVDAYLCPSEFLKRKFRQFGFQDSKLHVTNLCYNISQVDDFLNSYRRNLPDKSASNEEFILYVGRIEEIKGIETLIKAVKDTPLQLKVAGTGDAMEGLKELVKRENYDNVQFLGFQDKNSVFELTIQSKFVVCPSEWYENFPFSIIESFLFSKPVVASDIGGIPELVVDGETGYLFAAGNVEQLRGKLLGLWNDTDLTNRMGNKARQHVYDIVNFDTHWNKLNSIINSISNGN
jgi:glycosyltransferase involved in cell wall biosynthesis